MNQRFGSSAAAYNTLLAPVSVVAMLRWDTAPTRETPDAHAVARSRPHDGRATGCSEALLKALYGTNAVFNPLPQILRQSDTLKLTGDQADSIATLNRWYTIKVDSIWTPVAKALAALPDPLRPQRGVRRGTAPPREATVDLLLKVAPGVKRMLTADQRRKLPDIVTSSLDTWYPAVDPLGNGGLERRIRSPTSRGHRRRGQDDVRIVK